ncbi:MAG: TlpA disulfide reductase family protein [Polyangiaceae bacterium]
MSQVFWRVATISMLGCACTHEGPKSELPRSGASSGGAATSSVSGAPMSGDIVRQGAATGAGQERFIGHAAPSLDGLLPNAQSELPAWAALRGRVVLLEFWSPWCGICQLVHQRMNEWSSRWPNSSVQLLGVAAFPSEDVRRAASRLGLAYPALSDPDEIAFRAYDVHAVPSLFLIDRNGAVADVMTGYSSARLTRIEGSIAALVGTP